MTEPNKLREWLVIEDSRKNAVFAPDDANKPKGYIPRDVAEKLLGRDLGGAVWFTREDSEKMRVHPDWREDEPPLSDTQTDLTERARAVVVAIKIESANRPQDVRQIMERRIAAALQSEREAAAAEARRALETISHLARRRDGGRTADEMSSDLMWIDDICRRALASPAPRGSRILSDEMGRLAAAKDAEIAALKHDIEQALASLTAEANALDKADEEIAALTKERDAALEKADIIGNVCGEAYQVLGALAHYTGTSDHPDVIRAMDNLAYHDDPPHGNLLPWPKILEGLETKKEIAALTEQRDRAMKVVEAARVIVAEAQVDLQDGTASKPERDLSEALTALDAEAAPSLPETPAFPLPPPQCRL